MVTVTYAVTDAVAVAFRSAAEKSSAADAARCIARIGAFFKTEDAGFDVGLALLLFDTGFFRTR